MTSSGEYERPNFQPPDISETAHDLVAMLGVNADKAKQDIKDILNQNNLTRIFTGKLLVLASWAEPVDRILGKDPLSKHTQAFMNGAKMGVFLGQNVRSQNPYEPINLLDIFQHDLLNIEGSDEVETSELRTDFLVSTSLTGLEYFPDLAVPLDSIADKINPDARTLITFKAGCGLAIRILHEAWQIDERLAFDFILDSLESESFNYDYELGLFLSEPDNP